MTKSGGSPSSVTQKTDREDAVPPRTDRGDAVPSCNPYAFKCTASLGGAQYLADLRGATRSHFIATTVDLLTSGVSTLILNEAFYGLEQGVSGDKHVC